MECHYSDSNWGKLLLHLGIWDQSYHCVMVLCTLVFAKGTRVPPPLSPILWDVREEGRCAGETTRLGDNVDVEWKAQEHLEQFIEQEMLSVTNEGSVPPSKLTCPQGVCQQHLLSAGELLYKPTLITRTGLAGLAKMFKSCPEAERWAAIFLSYGPSLWYIPCLGGGGLEFWFLDRRGWPWFLDLWERLRDLPEVGGTSSLLWALFLFLPGLELGEVAVEVEASGLCWKKRELSTT